SVIADMRGKENYELGDLTLALDKIVKDEVCKVTGKDPGEYEMGDLSKEVDRRVKVVVADFCGKVHPQDFQSLFMVSGFLRLWYPS
ncbi:hypothetical protein AK812_SmicGene45999, partial [Symbiodinium microadriaticum]